MAALVYKSVAASPTPVHSQAFGELAIYSQHSAPAAVIRDNHSRISAELQARIQNIPVRVGNGVPKGRLLIQLEQRDFELVLTREDNKARFITLPHAQTGRPAAVEFAPDTAIITDGRYRLRDGDSVNLVETATP